MLGDRCKSNRIFAYTTRGRGKGVNNSQSKPTENSDIDVVAEEVSASRAIAPTGPKLVPQSPLSLDPDFETQVFSGHEGDNKGCQAVGLCIWPLPIILTIALKHPAHGHIQSWHVEAYESLQYFLSFLPMLNSLYDFRFRR